MVGNIQYYCVNCGKNYTQHSDNQLQTCIHFLTVSSCKVIEETRNRLRYEMLKCDNWSEK